MTRHCEFCRQTLHVLYEMIASLIDQPTARRKMLCMFTPRFVGGFPTLQSSTTVEAGALVCRSKVEKPSLGKKSWVDMQAFRTRLPLLEGAEPCTLLYVQRMACTFQFQFFTALYICHLHPIYQRAMWKEKFMHRHRTLGSLPLVYFTVADIASDAIRLDRVEESSLCPSPTRLHVDIGARFERVSTHDLLPVHGISFEDRLHGASFGGHGHVDLWGVETPTGSFCILVGVLRSALW